MRVGIGLDYGSDSTGRKSKSIQDMLWEDTAAKRTDVHFGGTYACEISALKDLFSKTDKGPTKKKESKCLGRQDDGAKGHELTSYYENTKITTNY